MLAPSNNQAVLSYLSKEGTVESRMDLPQDFNAEAHHLLRVEASGPVISLSLDAASITPWRGIVAAEPNAVALVTQQMCAAFAAFELTVGWQDLFDYGFNDWQPLGAGAESHVDDDQLWLTHNPPGGRSEE